MPTAQKKDFPKSMSFRACIYPSESNPSDFTAHCLELDVIGQDATLEGAIAELLEAIEAQLEVCAKHGAQFEFWAPGIVWYKYEQAKRANRKVPDELLERIMREANQRLRRQSPVNIDSIAGTKELMPYIEDLKKVTDECPLPVG